jgi:multiple sugar transport system permease protein
VRIFGLRLATLVGLLCACLIAPAEIVENLNATGPKVTVRYAIWGGADEVTTARGFCKRFVQLNPNIRVDVAVYPWGQYWAKLQTQMASGLAPDVMAFYSGSFGVWVSRGALLSLDQLAKQTGFKKEEYEPAAIENCSWNGHLYTVPTDIAIWSLVYSTDRLEESGIPRSQWPSNTRPMSWDAFNILADKLTLNNGDGTVAQYGMSAGQNWDLSMIGIFGGDFVDRPVNPTRSVVAGNEKLIRGLDEIFDHQYAQESTMGSVPLSNGAFAASSDTALLSPKFCMGTTGPWALKELKDGGVHFGLAPLPEGTRPHTMINVNSVAIYSHSQHPMEAWRFASFLGAIDQEQVVGKTLKGIPTLKAALPSFLNNQYGIKGCEAFLHDLSTSEPAISPDNTSIQSARDDWLTSVEGEIEAEHDSKLGSLPKAGGKISAQDRAAFATSMKSFIDSTIRGRLPELDHKLGMAFAEDHPRPASPFVRFVLPILGAFALCISAIFYIKTVGKSRTEGASPGGSKRDGAAGYLFISPWLFGLCCFTLGPILAAIALSFTNWNMISPPVWVGAKHYLELPQDSKFLIGIKNTFAYALFVIPISLVGGLFTAGLLTARIRGSAIFKAIIYFPALFTGAETAVLWVNMLNKDHGVFNAILGWFGIAPVDWMDSHHAFMSVVFMNFFWIGGAMLIYYAGMKQIPESLYEAAELDGATMTRRFLQITIPLLSPVILFMVVITTIGAFQVFTPALFFAPNSTSIGAPDDSLRFYAVNIYDKAFNNLQMGEACSYAIVLFLIIFTITVIQLKLASRFVHSETS